MRHIKSLCCLALAMIITPATQAVQVEDLYVAEVLVADESAAQLRAGARAGLAQILVRVSGQVKVEEIGPIRSALRRPSDFYNQFSYESTERQLVVDSEAQTARVLKLHFEPSAIARLLREADLPVWGSNRPGVMLWVAISDGNSRRILGEADEGELALALVEQAARRGLPILFPILDLEDASRISSAEVWGAFLDRIETASVRYQPDAILTARVQQEMSGRWTGKWSYKMTETWQSVETVAFSSDELVRAMVDQLADQLAVRYALDSSRGTIELTIEGVHTLEDYAALGGYLDQLAPVLNSSIVSLLQDVARFELRVEGTQDQLVELIELDQRMLLLNNDGRGDHLLYRWKSL